MRKITLTTYKVKGRKGDGSVVELDYNVKESLVELLFNPSLKLRAADLIRQNDLGKKILDAGDEVELNDDEYERVLKAVNAFEGMGRNEVEMVTRVIKAAQE